MDLRLSPNEYLDTSRALYERAEAIQVAYHRGRADAAKDHREAQKQKAERERRQAETTQRLKEKFG